MEEAGGAAGVQVGTGCAVKGHMLNSLPRQLQTGRSEPMRSPVLASTAMHPSRPCHANTCPRNLLSIGSAAPTQTPAAEPDNG